MERKPAKAGHLRGIKRKANQEQLGDKSSANPPSATRQVEEMMAQYQKGRAELQGYMNLLTQQTGMSIESMVAFIDNPNNFANRAEWQAIQQKRQMLREIMLNPAQALVNQQSLIERFLDSAPAKARVPGLRKKQVGNRRNWIAMR